MTQYDPLFNSSNQPLPSSIASPCRSQCHLDTYDTCSGCGRTIQDILHWSQSPPSVKIHINRAAQARRTWHEFDGRVRAVLAQGPLGEIGFQDGLPWKAPSELQWFKTLTVSQTLIVGRSTWNRMSGSFLGRNIAVVSSTAPDLSSVGTRGFWAQTVEEAIDWAFELGQNPCLIGGAHLWNTSWHLVEAAWITSVQGPMNADTFFQPNLDSFSFMAEGPNGQDFEWQWNTKLWERSL